MLRISWSNRNWPIGNKTLQNDPHILRGVFINRNFDDILQKMMRVIWKMPLHHILLYRVNPIFFFFFFRALNPQKLPSAFVIYYKRRCVEIRDIQDWIFQLFFYMFYTVQWLWFFTSSDKQNALCFPDSYTYDVYTSPS